MKTETHKNVASFRLNYLLLTLRPWILTFQPRICPPQQQPTAYTGMDVDISYLSDQSRSYWHTNLHFWCYCWKGQTFSFSSSPQNAWVLFPLCQQQFFCVQPTSYKRADTSFQQDQFPDSHKHWCQLPSWIKNYHTLTAQDKFDRAYICPSAGFRRTSKVRTSKKLTSSKSMCHHLLNTTQGTLNLC